MVVSLVQTAVKSAPEVAQRVREDLAILSDVRRAAKAKAKKSAKPREVGDVAAAE